jgi:two-component system LytT family sensor kinase
MKTILVHLRYILIIIVILMVISLSNYVVNKSEIPTWNVLLRFLGWTAFYTFPLYLANGFIYHLLDNKIPDGNLNSFIKKFFIGLLLSSVISILVGGILFILNMMIDGSTFKEAMDWVFSAEAFEQIKRLIWISASIAFTIYLIRFILKYQADRLKEQKEKYVKITTEHESLKSQIGPHFLFNSLNVLNGLIEENPDKAQEFVGELSSIYRYVLEQKDKSLVSLEEELNFSRTYMNLVQKRFEDGLEFEIIGEPNGNQKIVPLSLQILLENSIKHNRISSIEPLVVKIIIEEKKIWIINNLQKKAKLTDSIGKGLRNIIDRYKSFTHQKVEILETQEEFKVKLPLLTDKIIEMENEVNYSEEEFQKAKKRIDEIQGYYWNLASYIVINIFFTFLDLKDGSYDWAFWPAIGWGIGIAFHTIEVFGFFNNDNWKDRMIKKELERRKREHKDFINKF